ncbi:MAG TPA: serine protease [Longimicrobiales bacterium]|nr:serine protease [Longimicrobiales bacterium]
MLVATALAFACGRTPQIAPGQTGPASYYQTAPGADMSPALERVFGSVHQIEFTADYVTYEFDERSGVTEGDIVVSGFEARADTSFSETVTKAGTATVISRSGNRLTLLTVSHVVHFPDIRFRYYDERPARAVNVADPRRRVASASVRTAERGRLMPRSGPVPFHVRARDDHHDLALLRLDLPSQAEAERFPVLTLATGDARRLSWGSFLYVLGHPRGYPMVTRAIVSSPDWDGRGAFITDGIWNEGMSGGVIVAMRGETGALELVGLARASAAERVIRILPDTTGITPGSPTMRYDGPLFVETGLRAQYGIALPVTMTTITEFLRQHGVTLRRD